MDDQERQHLEDLLHMYRRRLRPLEKQEALLGPRTPPDIHMEIEDTRDKINQIEAHLLHSATSTLIKKPFSDSQSQLLSQKDNTSHAVLPAITANHTDTQGILGVDLNISNPPVVHSTSLPPGTKVQQKQLISYISEHPAITIVAGALLILFSYPNGGILSFLGFLMLIIGIVIILPHRRYVLINEYCFQQQYLPEEDNTQEANLRYSEAINLIIYLRKSHIQIRPTSSNELEVISGKLKQETKAKLERLKNELLVLLQPDNHRAAAFIILAWIRDGNIDLEYTYSGDLHVVRGKLSSETQTEVNRLKPYLLEILRRERTIK